MKTLEPAEIQRGVPAERLRGHHVKQTQVFLSVAVARKGMALHG